MNKVIASLLLILVCQFASAEILPVEQFSKHSDYLDMKISPDGKHLLARVHYEGEVSLIILDSSTMKIVGGVKPLEGDSIHSAHWISNERVMYQFAEKRARLDAPLPTGELFAINIDGSRKEMLYGFRAGEYTGGSRIKKKESTRATPQLISVLEDDEDHVLIMEFPWSQQGPYLYDLREKHTTISKLNVFNGRKTEVEILPNPGAQAVANAQGEIRFMRWTDEQNEPHGAFRENQSAPWVDIKDAFNTNLDLVPVTLSKDSNKVVLSGRLGAEQFSTLYALDIKNKKLEPLFSDLSADIAYTMYDRVKGIPVVATSYPGLPQYHYVEGEQLATLHGLLVEAFGGQNVYISGSTKDGKTLLLHISSDSNPGEYYLFDTEKMDAKFLWANRSWLDPRKMAKTQSIKFTTKDGLDIYSYLTLPTNPDATAKPPLVTMVHGGPHGPYDTWGFDGMVQFLANRGYAVLQVNFRGSGGFGKAFEEAGYRQWGGKMIDDITDATQNVVDQGLVDGNRMCIYGASYGGYAALMSVVRQPDLFKCAIGYVGIYNLEYAYTDSDITMRNQGTNYLKDVIGTDKTELARFSPVHFADKIKANVFLIHGEKDARVAVRNSEDMRDALVKAGKQVPYLNFSNSGHGVYDEEGRRLLYSEIEKYLAQQL